MHTDPVDRVRERRGHPPIVRTAIGCFVLVAAWTVAVVIEAVIDHVFGDDKTGGDHDIKYDRTSRLVDIYGTANHDAAYPHNTHHDPASTTSTPRCVPDLPLRRMNGVK